MAEQPLEAFNRFDHSAIPISQAIDQLSPDHKAVIELTFYQGLSYQEIAEIIKSPVNTVKTRMFYAKEKLKNILMEYGIRDEVI